MKNILIDLIYKDPNHGQVEKAFKGEFYEKWGLNYLLSFLRFHILEQCGNFKDQFLKNYSNGFFEEKRKIGNKIFVNLPSTEKICGVHKIENFQDIFYNAYGGCFNGDAIVELKNGKKK